MWRVWLWFICIVVTLSKALFSLSNKETLFLRWLGNWGVSIVLLMTFSWTFVMWATSRTNGSITKQADRIHPKNVNQCETTMDNGVQLLIVGSITTGKWLHPSIPFTLKEATIKTIWDWCIFWNIWWTNIITSTKYEIQWRKESELVRSNGKDFC
jgi:hypothetical protein